MRKIALSGLALGAAMVVGTAQAEPVNLSADQLDQVTAAGFAFVKANKIVNINENVRNTPTYSSSSRSCSSWMSRDTSRTPTPP